VVDLMQDSLLGRVGFNVLAVGAEPIAKLNVPNSLAVRTLMVQSVARALAYSFA
jgi:hypothetical protein